MSLLETEQKVLTVSELNREAKHLLEGNFPLIWVEGEISNIARPASGHIYFSMKDETAQVRCAMFRFQNQGLNFQPKDGMQIKARAKVSLYEGRGDYQLLVNQMEEAGDGALRRAFDMLKAKLAKEGLFEESHKKPIPDHINRIGVVTSSSAAALQDVLTVLKRRFPAISVTIYPTQVQGTEAARQIVDAIQTANKRNECDCLIVTRGGGSLEDLWSFNEEKVARAIFESELPIISAVGHEIDFTIADFVADHRAPTPSAAAELASPDQNDYLLSLTQLLNQLHSKTHLNLEKKAHALTNLKSQLRHPGQLVQEKMQQIDYLEQRIKTNIQNVLKQIKSELSGMSRALDAVSPLSTLDRGYSIVANAEGEIVTKVDELNVGEQITARLKKGFIDCTIDKIRKK